MSVKFWDKQAKSYDKGAQKHGSGYLKLVDRTSSLLGSSDVVLDLGCATGEITLGIAPHVKQILGIDSSGKMIQIARQKASDRHVANAAFHSVDAFDRTLAETSPTAVLAFNVFHLLDDVPGVMARLHELMAEGALLISKTPCLSEWNGFVKTLIVLAQKVGLVPRIRSFTRAELADEVKGAGFEMVEAELWEAKTATQWVVARKI